MPAIKKLRKLNEDLRRQSTTRNNGVLKNYKTRSTRISGVDLMS